MRILFCSHNPLDLKLGAPKVIMEVASAMEKIGWQCKLASDTEICPDIRQYQGVRKISEFSKAMARFLKNNAQNYDVADYDHLYLPFQRSEFSRDALFVARSVLLEQHFEKISIPRFKGFKSLAGLVLKGPTRYREMKFRVRQADKTMSECDLVNVSNDHDRDELIARGIEAAKILVVPFGLNLARLESFSQPMTPDTPRVAFVGTFDARKGGVEFPDIVDAIARALPQAKFRLLGASYRSREQILNFFPERLHPNLEVITNFEPAELPHLLKDCSIGVFPSYIEGFGFGVLEMLAASMPVIAYDAPGPPMMLPREYLVARGDWRALAKKSIGLLQDTKQLSTARAWARLRARDFLWDRFAEMTSQTYLKRLKEIRSR